MKVAIVKPDHFGDLILSSAAIRVVMSRYPNAVLFVSPQNVTLARFLFGESRDIQTIIFPHLSKHRDGVVGDVVNLLSYDLVLFLRNDGVLNPNWADVRCRDFILPIDTHDDHQSLLDYGVVSRLVGHYDINTFSLRNEVT